jgi:hypothetical protein
MKLGALVPIVAVVMSAPVCAQTTDSPLPDTATVRWMRDTVVRDLANRSGMVVGVPRFHADTAYLTASRMETTAPDRVYVFSIDHRFERRNGAWVLMPTRLIMHGHGI